jgi:hypothetical protein
VFAASVPENETGYPYPSGSKVGSAETSTSGHSNYTGSTGLYGFRVIEYNYLLNILYTSWYVFRISSKLYVNGDVHPSEAIAWITILDGSSELFRIYVDDNNHPQLVSRVRIDIYYIKA